MDKMPFLYIIRSMTTNSKANIKILFAFGMGGILSPVVGKLADIYSINNILIGVSFLPLLALPLIAFFPRLR